MANNSISTTTQKTDVLANRLLAYRSYLGWSQEKAAEQIQTSPVNYGRLERGERFLSHDGFLHLSKGFDIDISAFMMINSYQAEIEGIRISPCMAHIISLNKRKGISIHVDSNAIFELNGLSTENITSTLYGDSIWFDGYVASMIKKGYELRIFAEGHVEGVLYKGGEIKMHYDNKDLQSRNEIKDNIAGDKILYGYTKRKKKIDGILRCPYTLTDIDAVENNKEDAFLVRNRNKFKGLLISNKDNKLIMDNVEIKEHNLIEVLKMGGYMDNITM